MEATEGEDADAFEQEYKDLDCQLDQLDVMLTSLENKRDLLHQEALKFLQDAKAMRSKKDAEGPTAVPDSGSETSSDQTKHTEKSDCSDE
ncbi:hypothetical protein EMCRGX_G020331 [Ephydatia muelleri]|eukprot:Em0162g7a